MTFSAMLRWTLPKYSIRTIWLLVTKRKGVEDEATQHFVFKHISHSNQPDLSEHFIIKFHKKSQNECSQYFFMHELKMHKLQLQMASMWVAVGDEKRN